MISISKELLLECIETIKCLDELQSNLSNEISNMHSYYPKYKDYTKSELLINKLNDLIK